MCCPSPPAEHCSLLRMPCCPQMLPAPLPPAPKCTPMPLHRAQKELNIEKQIKKVEDTWAGLNLQFVPYEDTDIASLQVCGAYI